MSTYTRKIIAVRGDTQSGDSGGLLNPETLYPVVGIDEDGTKVIETYEEAHLNPVQRQLWKWSEEDRANVQALAEKDEVVFLEMGDMTQGARFTDDLKETSLSRQTITSYYNSLPWLGMDNVFTMRAVKGTGVHVWGEGSTETILTMLLQRQFPQKDVKISDHYLLWVDRFSIDVSHHGPGAGIRNWTRGNAFELYVKSILMDDLNAGRVPPSIVLRGHKHQFTYAHAIHQVNGSIWQLPGFIVPPYAFINSHAQKAVNSPSSMGVGTLAFELINGSLYKWHHFTHFVDLRTEEILHGHIENSGSGGDGGVLPGVECSGGTGSEEGAIGGTAGDRLDDPASDGPVRSDDQPGAPSPEQPGGAGALLQGEDPES